jgi:hypothetical protein
MEQTLTSDSLISKISRMTIFDQFAQTIFVEDTQGVIEVENSYKESNSIKFVRTEISYKLKNHRIISKNINSRNIVISDLTEASTITLDKSVCRCVSSDLNKLFIQELNIFEGTKKNEYNLFSQNIFQKLFYPNTKEGLIEKFIEAGSSMSWAIIPYNLLSIFFESDKIKICKEENEKIIYHLGSIAKIDIYVNPNDESGKIFYGNFDSIIILANKYMNIVDTDLGTSYNFEYLFIEQGLINSLQVI